MSSLCHRFRRQRVHERYPRLNTRNGGLCIAFFTLLTLLGVNVGTWGPGDYPRYSSIERCDRDYRSELLHDADNNMPLCSVEQVRRGSRRSQTAPFDAGPRCSLRWFDRDAACNLVGTFDVLFYGDSLIRQLAFAMGSVLSGDYVRGGINPHFGNSKGCMCARQWHTDCVPPDEHRFGAAASAEAICSRWTRSHVAVDHHFGLDLPRPELTRLLTMKRERPVVVTDASALHHPHHGLNFSHVVGFYEELFSLVSSRGGWLIPMTIHYVGPNKPAKFLATQGAAAVLRYNAALHDWARARGIPVLDTYAFTYGTFSRDGVHYDDGNIGLIQLLLNLLQRKMETNETVHMNRNGTGSFRRAKVRVQN